MSSQDNSPLDYIFNVTKLCYTITSEIMKSLRAKLKSLIKRGGRLLINNVCNICIQLHQQNQME